MPDTLPLNPQFDDQKLLARIIDYYHRTFKETTEGLDYLRSRGVTVGEAIERFRIGYRNVTCTFGPDALTDDQRQAQIQTAQGR